MHQKKKKQTPYWPNLESQLVFTEMTQNTQNELE